MDLDCRKQYSGVFFPGRREAFTGRRRKEDGFLVREKAVGRKEFVPVLNRPEGKGEARKVADDQDELRQVMGNRTEGEANQG